MQTEVQGAVLSGVPAAAQAPAQAVVQAVMQAPMVQWTMAIPPPAVAEEGTKTSTVEEEDPVKKADAEVGGSSLGGLMREAAARKGLLKGSF